MLGSELMGAGVRHDPRIPDPDRPVRGVDEHRCAERHTPRHADWLCGACWVSGCWGQRRPLGTGETALEIGHRRDLVMTVREKKSRNSKINKYVLRQEEF